MAESKLKITAYKNNNFSGSGEKTFETDINPEKISLKRSVKYQPKNSTTKAGHLKFKGYDPKEMSFSLVFDSTGAVPHKKPVDEALEDLKKVVYQYKGNIHKPYFLKVNWGNIEFKCRLKSFQTEYSMFTPEGKTLRAKVSLAFLGFKNLKEVEAESNDQSPDMTHVKTVRVGDSLPMMCREVYGSFQYYLQIARINHLSNFRKLEPGSQLIFPPLEK